MKLCYKTWSWDALTGSQETSGSKQSREYTCVILKDTARRILQKIHAAEKLECFEALLELWQDDGPQGSDTSTTESIFGLLQILNGYKDSAIFSMFMDSLASRTNPSSVESAKRSSLSTNLYYLLGMFLTLDHPQPCSHLSLLSSRRWLCLAFPRSIKTA